MRPLLVASALALLLSPASVAQQPDHAHMDHGKMTAPASAAGMPQQTGEAAFAAIQEIVELLEADPTTDWSKVNIEALRQHLIDMNNVTLRASVKVVEKTGSITFQVAGEGAVRDSVRRMLSAHSATMNGEDGWKFAAAQTATGSDLTVTPLDAASMVKLRALGFIGVMTRGMHHHHHHLMIARGMSPHH
jgi:hypothetical protein